MVRSTVRIPLVVGTANYQPRLGHAMPVGTWVLIAPLDLDAGRLAASPPLEFEFIESPAPVALPNVAAAAAMSDLPRSGTVRICR